MVASTRPRSGNRLHRFRVYVVELGRFPAKDAVYVGSTRKSARARLRDHRAGGFTSSSRVRRYGTNLLPGLVENVPVFATREDAEQAEHELAAKLRARGYRVFGGSGSPMPRQPVRKMARPLFRDSPEPHTITVTL